jgi:hypothetical protein
MDIGLALIFLLSAAMLFVALKYGIVGGGGTVTNRTDSPIVYWIGVAVVVLIALGSLAALVSEKLR